MKFRYFLSLKYSSASEIMDYLGVNQGQEKPTAELVVVLMLTSCFPWCCGLLNWSHNFHGLPARGQESSSVNQIKKEENKYGENNMVKLW